jgi:hypothetical protein
VTSPCVLGLRLAEAQRRLEEAGIAVVRVTETAPPRGNVLTGPRRVLRQVAVEGGVSLVVAASVPPPGPEGNDGTV